MRTLALQRYEVFKQIEGVLTKHLAAFPSSSYGNQLLTELSEVIKELDGYFAEQVDQKPLSKSSTATKASLKATLLENLKAISRVARVLSRDNNNPNPGLEDLFQTPRGAGELVLIKTAHSFIKNIGNDTAKFIELGLPSNFMEHLKDLVLACEEIREKSSSGGDKQVASKASVDLAIEQGLNIMHDLDVLIENKFHQDKAFMAEWYAAHYLESSRYSDVATSPTDI